MVDVKISLSITIPGAQPYKEEDVLIKTENKRHKKEKYVIDNSKVNMHSILLKGDKKKGIPTERVFFYTVKNIPARQNINISSEAYYAMIDSNSCPEWEKQFIWKKMSKTQRLDSHMKRIAESFQGSVIGYHVFED